MFGGVHTWQALFATVLALLALRGATGSKSVAMIANGWYSERHAAEFAVTKIDWGYYTQMTYVWA